MTELHRTDEQARHERTAQAYQQAQRAHAQAEDAVEAARATQRQVRAAQVQARLDCDVQAGNALIDTEEQARNALTRAENALRVAQRNLMHHAQNLGWAMREVAAKQGQVGGAVVDEGVEETHPEDDDEYTDEYTEYTEYADELPPIRPLS